MFVKMQFFSHFLFLLCVSVLCITSTAGSYNHGHSKMDPKGQPQPHSMHKRQVIPEQCQQPLIDEICNNGNIQEQANLYLQCNDSQTAQGIRDLACSQNSVGKFCSLIDMSKLDSTIQSACSTSTSTCTTECKNSIIGARNLLGCCVNTYNGTSEVYSSLQYSLWSRCDVDLVTEVCSSTITLSQSQIDPTCNVSVLIERSLDISCRKRYVESLRDRLVVIPGCSSLAEDSIALCAANALGRYCITESLDTEISTASASCQNMDTCDQNCREALETLDDTGGCCINFSQNDTSDVSSAPEWLSFQFWTECGLTTPGTCEVLFSHAPILKAPGLAAMFAAVLILLVHM